METTERQRRLLAMTQNFQLNGHEVPLSAPSDLAVVKRVAAQFQRRIAENDWRPYRSQQEAIEAWTKLGGIRVAVMKALELL